MLGIEFLGWWYGAGWSLRIRNVPRRLTNVSHMFSLPILLRTLFAPWKRIISYPAPGLEAHLHAMVDNIVSRCVGFIVRTFVLLAAIVMLAFVAIFSLIELIIWPLLPLAIPASLIKGIIG